MSFNRLDYDTCTYKDAIKQSIKVGDYFINTPNSDCDGNCFYPNPYVRMDKSGGSICSNNLIDVDSELLGLNVKATKCPSEKFQPSKKRQAMSLQPDQYLEPKWLRCSGCQQV